MNLGGSVKINKFGICILLVLLLVAVYYTFIRHHDGSPSGSSGGGGRHDGLSLDPNAIQLRQLLIAAIQAAQLGGAEVVDVAKQSDVQAASKGRTKEGANDPVTNADVRSHCVMKRGLQRIFPRLRIVSEEDETEASEVVVEAAVTANNRCEATEGRPAFDLDPTVVHSEVNVDDTVAVDEVTVWIDPLDATQEFTENLVQYVTTMVCVAVQGRPVIGVIHNPFTQITSWAWAGKHLLSEDLAPLVQASTATRWSKTPNINSVVTISRSHAGDVAAMVRDRLGPATKVVAAGGAGYKVLEVAAGRADAYVHSTRIKKWDICAGHAILEALGGQMSGLAGETIEYAADGSMVNEFGVMAAFDHKYFIDKFKSKVSVKAGSVV